MDAELTKDIERLKFHATLQPDQYREDLIRRTIARLEALAVGDEPITEEWLRCLGDNWTQYLSPCPINGHCAYVEFVSDFELGVYANGLVMLCGACLGKKTRQHVVDLCAALGVGLTTENTQ